MVRVTVISCYSNSCCQTSVKLLATFAFQRTKLLRHKAPDFTSDNDMASQQTRPQFCRLQIIEIHSGMRVSETTRDVSHRRWAVLTEWHFINRTTYYTSQGRVETPIGRGGKLCCKFTSVSLSQKLGLACTMRFDKVIAKIKGCNFFATQCILNTLFCIIDKHRVDRCIRSKTLRAKNHTN